MNNLNDGDNYGPVKLSQLPIDVIPDKNDNIELYFHKCINYINKFLHNPLNYYVELNKFIELITPEIDSVSINPRIYTYKSIRRYILNLGCNQFLLNNYDSNETLFDLGKRIFNLIIIYEDYPIINIRLNKTNMDAYLYYITNIKKN